MSWLILIGGILLTAVSALTLFLGVRQSFVIRMRLRQQTGERMPALGAEALVLGLWTVGLAIGLWLLWLSQHLGR